MGGNKMAPLTIERDLYLAHALNFSDQEIELRKNLMEWMPESIIDCHVHNNLQSHVEYMEEKVLHTIISTFPSISIDESFCLDKTFYPGKKVKKLRFPHVFKGLDHKAANKYLLDSSPENDRVAIFGIPEDIEYTSSLMHHPRVSALKMYHSYINPTATTIYQYFIPEILEVAQDLELPIILHLPSIITLCVDDLLKLLTNFPRLRVILAHLGLSKIPVPGLLEAYKKVANFKQVSLDTAMNPSNEVISMAINAFGEDRIMFGSDEPINMLRYVAYMNHEKNQQRVVTTYRYHWTDIAAHRKYGFLAKGAPHMHWQSIDAIRASINLMPNKERERIKRKIFHDNSMFFFRF